MSKGNKQMVMEPKMTAKQMEANMKQMKVKKGKGGGKKGC